MLRIGGGGGGAENTVFPGAEQDSLISRVCEDPDGML